MSDDISIEDILDAELIADVVNNNDDDDYLSSWEMINPSDDDDDDNLVEAYSYEIEVESLSPPQDLIIAHSNDFEIDDPLDVKLVTIDDRLSGHYNIYYDDYKEEDREEGYDDDDDDDDEEEGYENDYDDELVPISVSDRFGKQRLTKLGNRACSYSKMNNNKKSKGVPCYYYNRPGGRVNRKRAK